MAKLIRDLRNIAGPGLLAKGKVNIAESPAIAKKLLLPRFGVRGTPRIFQNGTFSC
jgi:hypothetical protein